MIATLFVELTFGKASVNKAGTLSPLIVEKAFATATLSDSFPFSNNVNNSGTAASSDNFANAATAAALSTSELLRSDFFNVGITDSLLLLPINNNRAAFFSSFTFFAPLTQRPTLLSVK